MNRLHAALPTPIKKYVWDIKYRVLGYPRFVAPDDVLEYLSGRLLEDASVLDLGCGRGSLLRALRQSGWAGNYCGVDISKQAICDAQQLGDQRSSWTVSDFESFRSPFSWDVVAMVESLCYVKLEEAPTLLANLRGMLKPRGVLLVRLHERAKYQAYIDEIFRLYPHAARAGENLFCIGPA